MSAPSGTTPGSATATPRSLGGRLAGRLRGGVARWGGRGTAGVSIPLSVEVENVSLDYGEGRGVQGAELAIQPGEIMGLLGPSGCGKTSLLRVISGLESPTAGRVRLGGALMAGDGVLVEPDRRGVGYVFQDYALFPHLTVLENVTFGLRRIGRAEANRAGLRALARVGLESCADAAVHQLSGGEQQRVALARAVSPRPGVLLLDEPFSNLDPQLRGTVREETAALLAEIGATALLVTHDAEEAMRLSDRIALMRAGRVVQVGTAESLYRKPASLFAARFFGEFNEVEGVVSRGRFETPLGVFPAPAGVADGSRAVLCVRPHAIGVRPAGFCLPARVVSRRFLGETVRLQVAVNGLDAAVAVRVAASQRAEPGDDVGLDVARDEVLVFAATDA